MIVSTVERMELKCPREVLMLSGALLLLLVPSPHNRFCVADKGLVNVSR